jgi:hypothetical protein
MAKMLPMSQFLIVLDKTTDALWLRHPIGVDSRKVVINLDSNINDHGRPHCNNVIGWRNWLTHQRIEMMYCYQPASNFYALLTAAAALDIAIIIYLTGHISQQFRNTLKLFNNKISKFLCAGDFIAGQLRQIGIGADRISIDVPRVEVSSVQTIGGTPRPELRRRTGSGPVLLGLPRPGDWESLKPVIWAASMLKHIYFDLKLVLSGTCRPSERDYLRQLENIWDSQGLIYLDEDATGWVELAGSCNVIMAGGTPLNEVIRLLYARAAGTLIVAGTGQANEYLCDYKRGQIVTPAKPRHLAGAILSLLEKNTMPYTSY